jgi:protein disulfide-isomerase A6
MIIKQIILGIVLFISTTTCLYSPSDDVVQLTSATFKTRVLDSKELWLVEFYAPWCGHCKSLAPEWSKAAKALKGIVNIGAVDMTTDQSAGEPYGIQGFPTIKIFGSNKQQKPTDYNGARTAQAIVDEALNQLKSIVRERLNGGKSSSSSSSSSSGGSCSGSSSGSSGGSCGGSGSGSNSGSGSGGSDKDVVELTDSNFESLVLNSDHMWLVEFFAPWCGHCKNLAPEWARAATELKGKVKLGALDATVHQAMAQKYGVRGYPTIKYFAPGSTEPSEYDGGRTSGDIVQWAMNKFVENAPAPELIELTKQNELDDACDTKQLCLIAFLPKLFDCQSKCRNNYLKVLKTLGEKYKRNQWAWLWTESTKQKDLEKSLDVGGFGYPALAAVNSRKGKYVLMRGSFSETGINEFLRELSVGRGSTAPIPNGKMAAVVNVDEKWDGKDAKLVVEEDIDLSDVTLDDDDGSFSSFRKKTVEL